MSSSFESSSSEPKWVKYLVFHPKFIIALNNSKLYFDEK